MEKHKVEIRDEPVFKNGNLICPECGDIMRADLSTENIDRCIDCGFGWNADTDKPEAD